MRKVTDLWAAKEIISKKLTLRSRLRDRGLRPRIRASNISLSRLLFLIAYGGVSAAEMESWVAGLQQLPEAEPRRGDPRQLELF